MEISLSSPYASEELKAQTALMEVIDPELSINIIDLGLVYAVDFSTPDAITLTMTLSTKHCPMGDAIQQGVLNVMENTFPDRKTTINLVWEPEWNYTMISEAGKEQLGF